MVIAVFLAWDLALKVWIFRQMNCKIYTVHCTIRARAQSVRRQHRRRTSEKSEMVTYKDSTQVAINR